MSDRAITKDDVIWVLIRGTGLLLVLRALLYVPELIGLVAYVIYLGDISINPTENEKFSFGIPRQQFISSLAHMLFYGALGFYFLRRGAWMFRLLSFVRKERSNNTVEADAREGSARGSP